MPSAPELVNPEAGMWWWLAYELRFQRLSRNKSQVDTGKICGVDRRTVHAWESGINKPSSVQCQKIDHAWNTGGLLARIHFYARTGHDPDWFREYTRYEESATLIKAYELALVIGLLQTPEYARALFLATGAKDIDAMLAERAARQQILDRDDPPAVVALLSEAVLLQRIGGKDVMRGQLAHLLEMSERPNVIIRVVPFELGAHYGLGGSFILMSSSAGDAGFTGAALGGRLITERKDWQGLQHRHDLIGADALSRDATRSLIQRTMEGLQ